MPTPISLIFLPLEAAPIVTNPTCLRLLIASPLLEGGVKGHVGGSEVGATHEGQCIGRTPIAVHARVLPFDRQRTFVPDPGEGAEQRFEVHVAMTWGHKSPAPVRLTKVDVGAEDRPAPVE